MEGDCRPTVWLLRKNILNLKNVQSEDDNMTGSRGHVFNFTFHYFVQYHVQCCFAFSFYLILDLFNTLLLFLYCFLWD